MGIATLVKGCIENRSFHIRSSLFVLQAVLAILRKEMANGQKDWAGFASEIENVFIEVEADSRLADRRRELVVLVKVRFAPQICGICLTQTPLSLSLLCP